MLEIEIKTAGFQNYTAEVPARCATDLVVLAVSVAATVLRQDAALAIEHVTLVTLAALRAVLAAVPLATGGGALGLAHRHAAGVMAVCWTVPDWKRAETSANHLTVNTVNSWTCLSASRC